MSPRTNEQNQKRKSEKEQQILQAALYLFAENGFSSTSMQQIAEMAQVSKGNLYNYFTSKDALLERVFQHGLDQMLQFYAGMTEIRDEKAFERVIRRNFKTIREGEVFWKLYYSLVAQPSVNRLFATVFEPFLKTYMKLFEAYYRKKGVADPAATALLLGSSMDGIALGYAMMSENYPLDAVVDALIEKFK